MMHFVLEVKIKGVNFMNDAVREVTIDTEIEGTRDQIYAKLLGELSPMVDVVAGRVAGAFGVVKP